MLADICGGSGSGFSMCGFRCNHDCTDMMFCARQLVEKTTECGFYPLYRYNSIPRAALWLVLAKYGVPDVLINMIISLHDNMRFHWREIWSLSMFQWLKAGVCTCTHSVHFILQCSDMVLVRAVGSSFFINVEVSLWVRGLEHPPPRG